MLVKWTLHHGCLLHLKTGVSFDADGVCACVFPQTGLFVGSMLVSLQSCCLFVATLPYLKLLKVTQDCA